jgi:hypothetical protein
MNAQTFVQAPTNEVEKKSRELDAVYLAKLRSYAIGAMSSSSAAKVVLELTTLYHKALQVLGQNSDLGAINAAVGKVAYYQISDELKVHFTPQPIVPRI